MKDAILKILEDNMDHGGELIQTLPQIAQEIVDAVNQLHSVLRANTQILIRESVSRNVARSIAESLVTMGFQIIGFHQYTAERTGGSMMPPRHELRWSVTAIGTADLVENFCEYEPTLQVKLSSDEFYDPKLNGKRR